MPEFVIRFPACFPSTRGNRLERYEVVRLGGVTRIRLCTSAEVGKHLGAVLTRLGARASFGDVTDDEEFRSWTHYVEVDGALPAGAEDLLELLKSTLLLVVPPNVDSAIALDFYKIPEEEVDPRQWKNTAAGELVNLMKYNGQPMARHRLARAMADVVNRHPFYRETVLVSVPGSDSTIESNSQKLAREIADLTGRPLVFAKAKHLKRPAAKAGEQFDLQNEFTLDEGVNLAPALIVDDVYWRGRTLQGVAAAARRAGALSVHGIIGARTMRK